MRDQNRIAVGKVVDTDGVLRPLRVNPITGRVLCNEGPVTIGVSLPDLNARRDENRVVAVLAESPSGPVPVQVNPDGRLVCKAN